MKYYVAQYKGETLVFSQAKLFALGSDARELYSAVAFDPKETAVRWLESQGKKPLYVTVSQRSFGCWEMDYASKHK